MRPDQKLFTLISSVEVLALNFVHDANVRTIKICINPGEYVKSAKAISDLHAFHRKKQACGSGWR